MRVEAAKKASDSHKQSDEEESMHMRKARLSAAFDRNRSKSGRNDSLQAQAQKQRFRVMLIAGVLFALFYYWLKSS